MTQHVRDADRRREARAKQHKQRMALMKEAEQRELQRLRGQQNVLRLDFYRRRGEQPPELAA